MWRHAWSVALALGRTAVSTVGAEGHDVALAVHINLRFGRWGRGCLGAVFRRLSEDLNDVHVLLNTTLIHAHQQTEGGKGARATRPWPFQTRTDNQSPLDR